MKHIFTCLILIAFCSTGFGQYCGYSGPTICTPQGTPTQRGFYPPTAQWPAMVNGVTYNASEGFMNWDTVNYQGTILTVDSMRLDSVSNLPEGVCWSTGFANNTWSNAQYGCVVLAGTPCAPPGQYKMTINVTVFLAGVGAANLNLDQAGVYCFIRIVNSGETATAVDTTQTSSNPFIAYGPASPCQSATPLVNLGADETVCTNSSIILNPVISGGTAPYTYQWVATGNTLSCNTCANPAVTVTQNSTYTLIVTDVNGNVGIDTINYTLNTNTSNLSVAFSNSLLGCSYSFDTTTVSVTGGTAPYSINWGNGNAQSGLSSPTVFTYGQTGAYIVAVTDANSCVSTSYDTVKLNSSLIIALSNTTLPNCPYQNTGAIAANVTGGAGGYSYSWTTGATTQSITGIQAGNYDLTVTDAAYCTATASSYLNSVSDVWGYYVYLQETDANCSNNGAIQSYVYGGTPPYSYLWSNSATTANLSGLASGNYALTVSDQEGCAVNGNTTVNSACLGIISGTVYVDSLGNCVPDTMASVIPNAYITATSALNQNVFYGVTNANGFYSIPVNDTGSYVVQAISYGAFICNQNACSNSANAYIASLGASSTNNNLALTSGTSGFDLSVYPTWTAGNPGFTKQYAIYYENGSLTPYTGQANLTFIYDPALTYQYSAGPQPIVNLANNTLTWTFDTVALSYNQVATCYFMVPDTMSAGYVLHGSFNITPYTGDCDTSNNYFVYSDVVTGSFDPNEKDVTPGDNISTDDSVLTYTIHFQNTGTDSTHFIIVKDTLSPNLDPLTVRTVASSARYSSFNITGKGILTWTFNPYFLPDSTTNPGGSKGFVTFTVNKQKGLAPGAVISNTAAIYFDYNTPVITNTVADTVILPAAIKVVQDAGNIVTVKAFPVPFKDFTNITVTGLNQKYDFELYDVTGRLIRCISSISTDQFVLQRNNMASGVYLYRITISTTPNSGLNQVAAGRLIVE